MWNTLICSAPPMVMVTRIRVRETIGECGIFRKCAQISMLQCEKIFEHGREFDALNICATANIPPNLKKAAELLAISGRMSGIAFFGALELGAIYGVTAFGVFLTFRVLDFPDLTVESSFPLGGAAAAAAIVGGMDPWTACVLALASGMLAGMLTAFLAVNCGILNLLASILTMIAGFSVNLRVMGRPNISLLGEETIFSPLKNFGDLTILKPALLSAAAVVLVLFLARLLKSEAGLAMRAAGANPKMLRANGGPPGAYVYLGLMISNGLVALSGALFAQANGFADVTTGVGTIIFGLAAVILGETLIRGRAIWLMLAACLAGSVLYRLAVALALGYGDFLRASDLNLITAALVTVALVAPKLRARFLRRR